MKTLNLIMGFTALNCLIAGAMVIQADNFTFTFNAAILVVLSVVEMATIMESKDVN